MTDEALAGNAPAYIEGKHSFYTTNWGQVEVSTKTGRVYFACYGVGRNQGNTDLSVKIVDREFIVYKSYIGSRIQEYLCSKNYPYSKGTSSLTIQQVLQVLLLDDNNSQSSVYLKKELVRLMLQKLKFTSEDNKSLQELYQSWRLPIIKEE